MKQASHWITAKHRLARIGDETGSSTVEAALWMPIFMGLILLITNIALVFYGQSQAVRVLQDGNRAYSTGTLLTEQDVINYVTERLAQFTTDAVVQSVVHQGIIYTTAHLPIEDLAHIGSLRMFSDYNVQVASQQFVEYIH